LTYTSAMPRVMLNFQHYGDAWTVHFIQDDCRTTIGSRTRYFKFATLDSLRSFVTRCQPEDANLAGFEHSVKEWGRGSEYVHLTAEQYAKLKSTRRVSHGRVSSFGRHHAMTYGVTFTCHVRDHGTILTYKPASAEDAALLPSDPGMWITRFASVESLEETLRSVSLPTSIATDGQADEVFRLTRAQLAALRFPVHEIAQ